MGHLTPRTYHSLQKRMDKVPPGIFDSPKFYEILKVLFTEEEARLCALMPIIPFTVPEIAKIWQLDEARSQAVLNHLLAKGLLYKNLDLAPPAYSLAIPVMGFFEFSLMRTDGKLDHQLLSKLYYDYINGDTNFISRLFSVDPPIGRILAHEETLTDISSEILSYEKASHIIDSARTISVGNCFCRHKMAHLGRACNAPMETCLTFNNIAGELIKNNIAKEIDKKRAHEILKSCIEHGLAQIRDNVKDDPIIICNCCGCCCDLLLAYKRLDNKLAVSPSSYRAKIIERRCLGCGLCLQKCPVDAIKLVEGKYQVIKELCLGCGVCHRFCQAKAMIMEPRSQKVFVPENVLEHFSLEAADYGLLGNLVFPRRDKLSHRLLSRLVNFFTRRWPLKPLLKNLAINRLFVRVFSKTTKVRKPF